MLRVAVPSAILLAAALSAAAIAQTAPAPAAAAPHKHNATLHKSVPMTFTNPANHTANSGSMSGQGCIGQNANAAQTAVNPITGKLQAAPIVVVPVTKGGGSVAAATQHAQQNQACAHGR
jgi:hypothetical protein